VRSTSKLAAFPEQGAESAEEIAIVRFSPEGDAVIAVDSAFRKLSVWQADKNQSFFSSLLSAGPKFVVTATVPLPDALAAAVGSAAKHAAAAGQPVPVDFHFLSPVCVELTLEGVSWQVLLPRT
jgi:hypothetical protein